MKSQRERASVQNLLDDEAVVVDVAVMFVVVDVAVMVVVVVLIAKSEIKNVMIKNYSIVITLILSLSPRHSAAVQLHQHKSILFQVLFANLLPCCVTRRLNSLAPKRGES